MSLYTLIPRSDKYINGYQNVIKVVNQQLCEFTKIFFVRVDVKSFDIRSVEPRISSTAKKAVHEIHRTQA